MTTMVFLGLGKYLLIQQSMVQLVSCQKYLNGHSCTSFNNGSHTLIVSVGGENLGGGDNMIYNPHNVTQIMVVGEHIWELGIILILLFEIHFIFFWN